MTGRFPPYQRQAFYYETDQMGIIHHSNYIRWIEEARMAFLEQLGLGCAMLEAHGVTIPVTGVSCRYLRPVHFGETVSIFVSLTYFNGVRASFRYQLRTADGTLTTEAESSHCFLWQGKAPIDLKKRFPALCELAREAAEES